MANYRVELQFVLKLTLWNSTVSRILFCHLIRVVKVFLYLLSFSASFDHLVIDLDQLQGDRSLSSSLRLSDVISGVLVYIR